MNKKNKSFIIKIIVIVLVILSLLFLYNKLTSGEKKQTVEEAKKEDEIKKDEYNYVLYGHKSDLYKDYFAKLKEELLKDEVNDEEYAKLISELFVIDFYSLDNKTTNTDVGGLDFIYEDMKDNFVLKATDTLYKYIESNVYGDRKQELPKITGVEIKSITKNNVSINDIKDENGYNVVVSATYEKEMGYPKEINLSIVHKDKKLYIVEVK